MCFSPFISALFFVAHVSWHFVFVNQIPNWCYVQNFRDVGIHRHGQAQSRWFSIRYQKTPHLVWGVQFFYGKTQLPVVSLRCWDGNRQVSCLITYCWQGLRVAKCYQRSDNQFSKQGMQQRHRATQLHLASFGTCSCLSFSILCQYTTPPLEALPHSQEWPVSYLY